MVCACISASTVESMLLKAEEAQAENDLLELRLDSLWPQLKENLVLDLDKIFNGIKGRSIATLRSAEQGGLFEGDDILLVSVLKKALELGADYIDVEYASPVLREFAGSREKMICSFHDFDKTPSLDKLQTLALKMSEMAGIVKIVTYAHDLSDTMVLYQLSQFLRKEGIRFIVFAMGDNGVNTRILAPVLGSEFTFAALGAKDLTAPGQLSFREMKEIWNINNLNKDTKICAVFGEPIKHSNSPSYHMEAYKKNDINAIFLSFETSSAKEAVELAKILQLRQMSITAPLKAEIIQYLDDLDESALRLNAVNTVILNDNKLRGYNTDDFGFKSLLEENKIDLKDKRICLVGAGGAAKTVASVVSSFDITSLVILNRDIFKARELAKKYKAKAANLSSLKDCEYDILIDATSISLDPRVELEAPWAKEDVVFNSKQTVITLIYNPVETYLIRKAKAALAKAINGWDMFVGQAEEQLKLFLEAEDLKQ